MVDRQTLKGKFELDRFNIDPDVAEEIKIVAIDKWNNRAEKTIKVTIDLQSTEIAKFYEELNPNNIKVKTDNNKIAIIIGIEKYENSKIMMPHMQIEMQKHLEPMLQMLQS